MSEQEQEVETGQDLETAIDEASEDVKVQTRELDELTGEELSGQPIGLDNLMGVPVKVTVEVGRSRMTLNQLVAMGPGSLIPLDREAHEPADILVNGKVVARGEIVTIGEKYGIRVTEVEN